jgi:SAM-dependent methyltransferase
MTTTDGEVAGYWEDWVDIYDTFVRPPEDTPVTVDRLLDIAPGPAALELGVGTGRVALPLAQAGLEVTGVDLSPGLLSQLARKDEQTLVAVVQADIVDVDPGRSFDMIYAVFNTFCSLLTQERQVRCLTNAVQYLQESGIIVLETFAPTRVPRSPAGRLSLGGFHDDAVVIQATRADVVAQRLSLRHVQLGPGAVRVLRSEYRYVTPAELDLMATLAGLRLLHRWGSWRGTDLLDSDHNIISVYRRSAAAQG